MWAATLLLTCWNNLLLPWSEQRKWWYWYRERKNQDCHPKQTNMSKEISVKYIGTYRDGSSRAKPSGEIMAMSKKIGGRGMSDETPGTAAL
jgi:hypothetical protein